MVEPRRVIVDTDTAGDDAMALLLSLLSDRLDVEAITIVAGNVEFDYQVENAKHALQLAGKADEVPVYEGAREPLIKSFDHADYVHGEGGLGGELFPETGIDSADGFGPDAIVQRARTHPGELSLLCIGPLTNVTLALAREPDLPALLDDVWVMGGAVGCQGNVTPAAEYNFWVDPDAAKRVLADMDVTLVDWGLCLREAMLGPEAFERATAIDTEYADFFLTLVEAVREYTRAHEGRDVATQPDSLTAAVAAYPEIVTEAGQYYADVDEREGLTRGYSLVDESGVTGQEPGTRVVEAVDREQFQELFFGLLRGDPDAMFDEGP